MTGVLKEDAALIGQAKRLLEGSMSLSDDIRR